MVADAVIMWEDAAKFYKTSYLVWTAYTDLLMSAFRDSFVYVAI